MIQSELWDDRHPTLGLTHDSLQHTTEVMRMNTKPNIQDRSTAGLHHRSTLIFIHRSTLTFIQRIDRQQSCEWDFHFAITLLSALWRYYTAPDSDWLPLQGSWAEESFRESFAVNTELPETRSDEYDEDYQREKIIEYHGLAMNDWGLLHTSSANATSTSIDSRPTPSIDGETQNQRGAGATPFALTYQSGIRLSR